MKLNLKQELTTLDGKPMKLMILSETIANVIGNTVVGVSNEKLAEGITKILDKEEELTKNATVGMIAFSSLLAEQEGTPEEKYKRGRLAEKIYEAGEIELTIDDVKIIKDLVGKHQNTTTIVRVWDALEGNE